MCCRPRGGTRLKKASQANGRRPLHAHRLVSKKEQADDLAAFRLRRVVLVPRCAVRRRVLRRPRSALLGQIGVGMAQPAAYPSHALKMVILSGRWWSGLRRTCHRHRAVDHVEAAGGLREPRRCGLGHRPEAGARSAPDGYTLVMGIPAGVTIAPHIYPKLGYDPIKDLVPVAAAPRRRWWWWCRSTRVKAFPDLDRASQGAPGRTELRVQRQRLAAAPRPSGSCPRPG